MPKRIMQGTVVSDKGEKTVVVSVERRFKHPLFNKIIRKSNKFMAHDESNAKKIGDQVQIQECRPLSKQKRWEVIGGLDEKGAA